jgi:hypothetical protein
MAYEQADIREYSWGLDQTFGATTVTHQIVGPKGKVGFVRDISVDCATSFSGTVIPEIDIGLSSGDYTFGRYRLGTTASSGYGVGPHSASQEAITGNPPRTLADYTGHVVLDGGPLTSQGIAGGSYSTQVPAGRIPASGWTITNVVNGTSNVCRVYANGLSAAPGGIQVGQTVTVQGVSGATGVNGIAKVSAVDTTNYQWFELGGTTFGGTYTNGGIAFLSVFVTLLQGTGSGAGGGYVRVKIQWIGPDTP